VLKIPSPKARRASCCWSNTMLVMAPFSLACMPGEDIGGAALQKNFNDGELRYACNIPGGRRQRASAAASSVITRGLLRTSAIPASASASVLTSIVG
jgi:hypothetical protein